MSTNIQLLSAIRPSDIPAEYTDLVEVLGLDGFLTLVDLCGGQSLYIPKGETLRRDGRDREIRAGASTAATTARSPRSSAFPSVRSARSSTARAYENAVRAGERRQGLGQNSPASRPRPHFLCIFSPLML